MKGRPPLPEGPYLVVGLRVSGAAAALALRARGEDVLGCDAGSPEVGRLVEAGVEVRLDAAGLDLVQRARAVVKSPGVPGEAPVVVEARRRGLPVLAELELGWRLLESEFVAVTGTNGKTTTTELIGHIHREAGLPVAVAGNVGTAVCSLAGELAPDAVVACEAAAFQLEDCDGFAPDGAVLLNVTPDHLDRFATFDAYVDAKLEVFRRQGNDDVAVAPDDLGIEDLGGCARRVRFGTRADSPMTDREGHLWWCDEPLIAHGDIRLPGAHNRANAMAAAAVTLARGVNRDAVRGALASFAGVAHRLEPVADRDGVRYVNDSKATNVASTLVALGAFPAGGVHLILGGRPKGGGYAPLAAPVAERCAGVYTIGEAAAEIEADLVATGVPIAQAGDLARAVALARAAARPGEVVLLSPACASYDQYPRFEARGEHFRALAQRGRG